jgi:hypothetical protein
MSQSKDNDSFQWIKFTEHWGIFMPLVIVSFVVPVFMSADGILWMELVATGFGLMLLGSVLITYAKFPAYRAGCFFSFGLQTIPGSRVTAYRWGWKLFLPGMIMSLLLLRF